MTDLGWATGRSAGGRAGRPWETVPEHAGGAGSRGSHAGDRAGQCWSPGNASGRSLRIWAMVEGALLPVEVDLNADRGSGVLAAGCQEENPRKRRRARGTSLPSVAVPMTRQ